MGDFRSNLRQFAIDAPRAGWESLKRSLPSAFKPDFPFNAASAPFFYGWVILFAATVGIIASIPGQTMGVSVFTDILIYELGLSRVQLSLAYLVGTAASGFLVTFGGRLFDRWGARRMIVYSAVAFGVSLILMGQCDRIALLLSFPFGGPGPIIVPFLIIGVGFFAIRFLGQGMLTITSRSMLGKWFDKRRGLAFAINGVAASFAFSIAPKALDGLIEMFGWRGAYTLLGLLVGVGMALFGWALYRDNPEECGLEMDGGAVKAKKKESEAPDIVHEWELRDAIRTLPFWAFNLATAYFALLMTAYTFHVISIGEYAGLAKDVILFLFVPAAFISVVANFISGWASDHSRMKYILIALLVSLALTATGMLLLSSLFGQILIVIGMGASGGFFQTCIGVVWPRFFGRKNLGAIGGFNMSTIVIASALGPFLFSLVEKLTGNYVPIYIVSALIPILLLLTAIKADNPQRKASEGV